METTNKFDRNGQEIFVGDKVKMWWGSFHYEGQRYDVFRIHTITAYQVHEDNTGVKYDKPATRYILGRAHNIWEGKEVTKITFEEFLPLLKIKEDEDFFYNKDGEVEKYALKHFCGSEEEANELQKDTQDFFTSLVDKKIDELVEKIARKNRKP